MTAKTFRLQTLITIMLLVLAAISTLWLGVVYDQEDATRTIVPVYIGAAAAWLAFCLQRRIAHTNALRSLWERIVRTVQESIQLTRQATVNLDEYENHLCQLSMRIDEVRGVFKNVDEIYV